MCASSLILPIVKLYTLSVLYWLLQLWLEQKMKSGDTVKRASDSMLGKKHRALNGRLLHFLCETDFFPFFKNWWTFPNVNCRFPIVSLIVLSATECGLSPGGGGDHSGCLPRASTIVVFKRQEVRICLLGRTTSSSPHSELRVRLKLVLWDMRGGDSLISMLTSVEEEKW